GLSEYQRLFTTYERCQGGFVWEWIDHGIARHTGDGEPWFAYGGDFGEELHDGNFVCDGLLFPDRTPSPGLIEYKKVIEPVRIEDDGSSGTVRITNGYDFADLAHLAFEWSYDVDGETVEAGPLSVPALPPGESADLKLPAPPVTDPAAGETQWTVRAVLAEDTTWARKGHTVAWGQLSTVSRPTRPAATGAAPHPGSELITLGPAAFDTATGALAHLGAVPVTGLRLDVWRAPTDNDNGAPWQPDERYGLIWRKLGLHRMRHRLDDVLLEDDALVVRTRVAPAATDLALLTTYRWTAVPDRLRLTVSVTPEGEWSCPLPRLGIRFGVPASYDYATWFGGGPGEAYPDTRAASMLARWQMEVDEMQAPYVRPQENGARADVRWAQLSDGNEGIRIEGEPPFWFSARRWTSEQLDAAEHTPDLEPSDTVWVNLDHGQHGIGSQSCGPGVLPQHRLDVAPAEFSLTFSPLVSS
ncbi:beta-galactosidase domain 4-containing protein, partial [Streptomyces sp. KR80]|uniref:beta-galactosidase domain 4-containing protein n=1 Tax=Streptomyces sp. KR80 TaxID=3457426 RepID=UPI003FD65F5C